MKFKLQFQDGNSPIKKHFYKSDVGDCPAEWMWVKAPNKFLKSKEYWLIVAEIISGWKDLMWVVNNVLSFIFDLLYKNPNKIRLVHVGSADKCSHVLSEAIVFGTKIWPPNNWVNKSHIISINWTAALWNIPPTQNPILP